MGTSSGPIDWGRAERVAVRIANRRSPTSLPPADEWHAPIEQIEQQIEDVTGLRSLQGAAKAQLIDRPEWIRANISSFQRLLDPVLERWVLAQRSGGAASAMSFVSRQLAGAQFGALLGWMSTRVLGQYDLLVGDSDDQNDSHRDDAVYLVGPNLAAVEKRFGFSPYEFRTWVLIHELTHRAQFTGVPWMRGHFTGLVQEALQFIDPDPQALLDGLRESLRDRNEARQRIRENGVVGLIASPEQRAVIARIGGLMSLLEGHGDVTMTRAAGDLVPSADRFAHVLEERRRRANPLTKLILRLTGMEAKLNQYAAGERFIAAIEDVGGPRAVDPCWQRPENLPSLDEIRTPTLWLHRTGELVA